MRGEFNDGNVDKEASHYCRLMWLVAEQNNMPSHTWRLRTVQYLVSRALRDQFALDQEAYRVWENG